MIVRTISQLPLCNQPDARDLFEVSKYYDDRFRSERLPISSLESKFTGDISSFMGNAFSMYQNDNKTPININALSSQVNRLYNGTVRFNGDKSFTKVPRISQTAQYTTEPDQITNVKKVKELIDDHSLFIGDTYMVDADPGTDNTPATMYRRDEFMYWHFDDFGTDSSEWKNPEYGNVQTDKNGIECRQTGYLNIFGWLADNGNVQPEHAWVGLFGYVQVFDETSPSETIQNKWIMLQMQPWIIGAKSSARQYVSFNLPVKAGLRLKIKTGFQVNGHNGGYDQSPMLALNQPNAFVGYIIRAED